MNTATNQIFSTVHKNLWSKWISACIWNGLVIFVCFKGQDKILSIVDEHPAFYLFGLFPLAGLWLLYLAFRESLAWRKFGKLPVTLKTYPCHTGADLSAYLDIKLPSELKFTSSITLSCRKHSISKDSRGRSRHISQPVWQDKIQVMPSRIANFFRLNFTFDLPGDLPATEPISSNYHEWVLLIKIPLPGVDFERTYVVPVDKGENINLAPETGDRPDNHKQKTQQHFANTQSTPKISKTLYGQSFHFGYARDWPIALIVQAFGIFLGIFGHFFFSRMFDFLPLSSYIMSALVYLSSLALLLFGVFLLANNLTVTINSRGINKQQRFLGYTVKDKFNAADIVDIVVEQNGSSTTRQTTRIFYALKLITTDGKSNTIGNNLEGQSYAHSKEPMGSEPMGTNGNQWGRNQWGQTRLNMIFFAFTLKLA